MIDLYSASSNLGDNLSLTPLARVTPCRIHLFDDASVRAVAPIFDGIAEVVFDNGSPTTHAPKASAECQLPGPHSAKLMRGQAPWLASQHSPIPSILLTDDEISRAKELVSGLSNPCIIKANTSKRNYRTPPAELMQQIVNDNPGVTFLTTALSPNHPKNNFDFTPLGGVFPLWDLPIRQMAAIYACVGRLISGDTGDMHLMLAVGGKVDCLVPDSNAEYPYEHFHYDDSCWTDNKRIRYHPWNQPFNQTLIGVNLNDKTQ